jgi:hypothetical protein
MTSITTITRAGTLLTILFASLWIGSTPAVAQNGHMVLAQQSKSVATDQQIMMKLKNKDATPLRNKFSAGEVVTTDQEVRCYKKKNGGYVQVRCPDKMIVTTK